MHSSMSIQQLVGQTLGGCKLLQLVGVGGMGTVYRATQLSLDREVAVKVIAPELLQQATFAKRFYQEAKIAASLDHIHIVPVYDYGVEGAISFVIMRLLSGGTLAQRITQNITSGDALPSLSEIARLLQQLGGALDYAHERGVIHRDIKATNVMFDTQGNAFLVDFGIAKLMLRTSEITTTQNVIGTPAFMSPEQWRVDDHITGAADQYSLGIVTYLLVTGKMPFEADTPATMMYKHLEAQPTPPQMLRPDLPDDVANVMERAIAKTPGDRFPSVTAFAQAFAQVARKIDGDDTFFFTAPIRVTLPAKFDALDNAREASHADPLVSKRPQLVAGVAILALVVVTILAFVIGSGSWGGRGKKPTNAESRNTPITDISPVANATSVTTDGVVAASNETLTPTPARLTATMMPETQVWLDLSATAKLWTATLSPTPTPTPASSHTPEITATFTAQANAIAQSSITESMTNPFPYSPPSSPTDTVSAASTSMSTLTSSDTPTPATISTQRISASNIDRLGETAWTQLDGGDVRVAWAPDGSMLAVTTMTGIVLYNPDNLEIEFQSLQTNGMITALAFSPNGATIAYGISGMEEDGIGLWNINTGARNVLSGHTARVSSIAFAPDGLLLASGSWDGTVRLWNPATGAELLFLPTNAERTQPVAISPDGQYLAAQGEGVDGQLNLYSISSGDLVRTLDAQDITINCLAFSPDGKLLVSGDAYTNTLKLWDVQMGQPVAILLGHTDQGADTGVYSVAFSPDNRLLVAGGADKTIRIWDVWTESATFGEELATLKRHTGAVISLAFSPDGTVLASSGGQNEATIRLWHIRDNASPVMP